MIFYQAKKKTIMGLLSLLCTVGVVRGCGFGLLDMALNNIQPCSFLNCEDLQIPDVMGRENPVLPDYPDYDRDPTCVIPGWCGPSPFFPFSTGGEGETGTTTQ